MGKRAQRIPSWPGVIHSNKGRIHLRRPTRDITFRLRESGGPYIPGSPSTDRDRQLFAASFFGGAGSLIHGRVVILSPRLRGLVLDKSSAAETTKMYRTGDEAQNSSSHTYSLACARGPIRRKGCLQRLLVHVLANRQRVSQEAARDQQGGISRSREEGSTSGLGRFRWRFGRWVVPAYAPR